MYTARWGQVPPRIQGRSSYAFAFFLSLYFAQYLRLARLRASVLLGSFFFFRHPHLSGLFLHLREQSDFSQKAQQLWQALPPSAIAVHLPPTSTPPMLELVIRRPHIVEPVVYCFSVLDYTRNSEQQEKGAYNKYKYQCFVHMYSPLVS